MTLVAIVAEVALYVASREVPAEPTDRPPPEFVPVLALASGAFAVVGAVVALRLPRHPVAWVLLGLGLLTAVGFSADFYADWVLVADPGAGPGGAYAVWFSAGPLGALFFLAAILLLLLFPDGRLVSPGWRVVAGSTVANALAGGTFFAVRPGVVDPGYPDVVNPLGWDSGPVRALAAAGDVFWLADGVLLLLAAGSLGLRWRRGNQVARAQVKWIAFAAGVMVTGFVGSSLVQPGLAQDLAWATGFAGLTGIPVAAGVAILRYRLYDIDVVIKRTLVYGSLVVVLGSAYLGLVLGLRTVLPFSAESDLAVAASTLAVAALFRPLRSRIQSVVDRRFYRSRYDAGRTLAGFSGRLRDELDLETLGTDLRGVVRQTMQPAHVSLWLREAPR